jgi:hypothetical protein
VSNYKYLIKSYEDMNIKPDEKNVVIILRDFTNFIASRYKKYGGKLGLNYSYLQDYEEIRDLWISLCNKIIEDKDTIGIIYNKWLKSKDYRDYISRKLGIENTVDNTSIVSDIGEGSSFCGVKLECSNEAYLNRFSSELFVDNKELYNKIMYDYENNESIKKIRKILFD